MVSSILKLFFLVELGESGLIYCLFSDCDPQIPNYHSLRPAKQKWGGKQQPTITRLTVQDFVFSLEVV